MSEVADAPAVRQTSGTPVRNYVVLERNTFDDDQQPYFVEIGIVEARNATNALRKAFREFKGTTEVDTTLVPVPEGMWRPTLVRGVRRDDVTISVG